MVKGAMSGVVLMVAITYGLLLSFGAMMVVCVVRARRLAALRHDDSADGDITPS